MSIKKTKTKGKRKLPNHLKGILNPPKAPSTALVPVNAAKTTTSTDKWFESRVPANDPKHGHPYEWDDEPSPELSARHLTNNDDLGPPETDLDDEQIKRAQEIFDQEGKPYAIPGYHTTQFFIQCPCCFQSVSGIIWNEDGNITELEFHY